jgi:3-phenylpropionate/trans-cinnamate dioxygenase ferredoxin reductase subunit
MSETYVIVGGGVAGTTAAESLRGDGFDGRIVVVSDEGEAPYERPPLSKGLLRGELEPASVVLRAPDFYEKHQIELRCKMRVLELDLLKRSLRCIGGQYISFDKLLIATGAKPRRLGIPGEQLDGVHYLRTLDDALALRAKLVSHPRVLVVGTGFIGCEVAASARQVGCEVTLAGPSLPMEHVLGKELAELYAARHLANGVNLRAGATVTEFRGTRVVAAARLSDGTELECDIAIVGVGVAPAIGWVGSQVAVSDGVDTDELCRTNIPGIFAAGDVACSWRPRLKRRVRLEHFDNAESQGAAAGKAMHGNARPYDPVPFFWSDQYDFSLQYYGFAHDWDRVVLRRYAGDESLVAFYLKDSRIVAACALNRSQDANAIKRLLGRTGISDADLADDTESLKSLIQAPEHT